MTLNDPTLIQLSADSRALVRNAIRANPGWKAYAAANDCDLASMTTKEAILSCCDALAIDVAKVVAGEVAMTALGDVAKAIVEAVDKPKGEKAAKTKAITRQDVRDEIDAALTAFVKRLAAAI